MTACDLPRPQRPRWPPRWPASSVPTSRASDAYAVHPSRPARSTPWRIRTRCARAAAGAGRAAGPRGAPLPGRAGRRPEGCPGRPCRHADALQPDAGQRLGRVDQCWPWPATCRAPPHGAGAFRDVWTALQGHLPACRSRPISNWTRPPCWPPSPATRPALLYLAYPNNPTANLWDDGWIDAIDRWPRRGLVVMDEAYQPFAARDSLARLAAPSACAGDAHHEQVRPGRRAHRLPDGRAAR